MPGFAGVATGVDLIDDLPALIVPSVGRGFRVSSASRVTEDDKIFVVVVTMPALRTRFAAVDVDLSAVLGEGDVNVCLAIGFAFALTLPMADLRFRLGRWARRSCVDGPMINVAIMRDDLPFNGRSSDVLRRLWLRGGSPALF